MDWPRKHFFARTILIRRKPLRLGGIKGSSSRKGSFGYLSATTPPDFDYTSGAEDSTEAKSATNFPALFNLQRDNNETKSSLPLLIALVTGACAACNIQSRGPVPSGRPYPITLTDSPKKEPQYSRLIESVRERTGKLTEGYLEPVTATIKGLPADLATPQRLPKVGSNAEMNEEEMREALRRFINDWRVLIGSNSSQLSLIERVDRPDGTKIAVYEQRAFRYPLRGNFGKLQIHFTADRRLLNLTSSCIPMPNAAHRWPA